MGTRGCGACGRQNRVGASFCAGCGSTLDARCPACGAGLVDEARFCDACGAPVAQARAPTGARKVVTVLFADVVGSTALQERLDAESTRSVIGRLHAILGEVIAAHGGTVVKFVGDGVMAVFGIRTAREDDAVRAVRAAIALQEAVGDGVGLRLRVGVNTGEVVVDPSDDDVVGDPVNVASRLEAAAGEGSVLVGPETAMLVRDVVAVEPVPPLQLRGKAKPVAAFRVVPGASPAPEPASTSLPFVGRADDVARLERRFDEVVAAGRARLVTVIGSPGLGKSRLADELARQLSDRARVLTARCDAAAAGTFAPLADALRPALGVDERTAAPDVRAAVGAVLGADADDGPVLDRIAGLLGIADAGTVEEAFWAVRRLLESMAAERPVVFVLDDAHWAEPAMLDLVEHLAEWTRAAPLLLVVLGRPELRERRPSLVEPGGPAAEVTVLDGLDVDACRRLTAELLASDAVPEDVLQRVLTGSEGNPLFLRELVRMLVDDGVLRRHGDRWTATVEAEGIELPASIHAVLAARIEQLDDDERAVLEAASVIGREFARGALAELLPAALAARLEGLLDALRRRELLDATRTYWVDERVHRFHHVLIRDAAYRRVLKEVRAEQHERYADWLAARAVAVSEHDEALGWHLEQASRYRGELGLGHDEENAGIAARAAGHLASAGRRALAADDAASAASLLGRALALVADRGAARQDLLRDRAEALLAMGDTRAAGPVVDELAAIAVEDRDRAVAEVYAAQLAWLRSPDELRAAADRAQAAARVLEAAGDDAGLAKAESVHAQALASLGQVGACEAALDRALAAARRAGDDRRANIVLAVAPLAALWGPSPVARASGRCLDVIRVLRITTWAPHVEAHALRCQAVLEAMRDRADAARRMVERARRTFEDLGDRVGLLDTALHGGLVELLAGEPAAAEAPLRAAMEGFDALGARARSARAAAALARALLLLERVDEADRLSSRAEPGDDLKAAIGLLGVRAEVLASRGRWADAEPLAREAVELASATDALVDHADARLSLARVLRAAGRGDEAAVEAARARDLYAAKGSVVGERAAGGGGGASGAAAASDGNAALRRHPPANAATASGDAQWQAMATGDAAQLEALYAPTFVEVHHSGETVGKEAFIRSVLGLHRQHDLGLDSVALATAGEALSVQSNVLRWDQSAFDAVPAGPTDYRFATVNEVDADGRCVRMDTFAADQLDRALVRFATRAAELDPDPDTAARYRGSTRMVELLDAINARDWACARSFLADGIVFIDHRAAAVAASLLDDGDDASIDALRANVAVAPDTRVRLEDLLGLDPGIAALAELAVSGHVEGGGHFDVPSLVVIELDDHGNTTRIEVFAPEQRSRALARFDEIVADRRGPRQGGGAVPRAARTQTAAERCLRRVSSLMERGAIDDLALAIEPDALGDDRRAGFRTVGRGQAHALAFVNAVLETGRPDRVDVELVATRGEQLCLARVTLVVGALDAEVEFLGVVETSEHDRLRKMVLLDPDAVDEAFAVLDERYLACLDPERQGVARRVLDGVASFNDADVARAATHLAPGFVNEDRRTMSQGEMGQDSFLAAVSQFLALTATNSMRLLDVVALEPWGGVGLARSLGSSAEGDPFEIRAWTVAVVGPSGIERLVWFDEGEGGAALACFEELGPEAAVDGDGVPSLAARLTAAYVAALGAGDHDAVLATFGADVQVHDRRLVVGDIGGHHTIAGSLAALDGAIHVDSRSIALRGERLAASWQTWYPRRTFEGIVELIAVAQADEAGEAIERLTLLEADDLEGAHATLDDWYGDLQPAARRTLQVAGELRRALNGHDPAAVERLFEPGAHVVDHWVPGFGQLDAPRYAALFAGLVEEVADLAMWPVELPTATEGVAVVRFTGGGEWSGAAVELDRWFVLAVGRRGIARLELFAGDDRDGALGSVERMTWAARGKAVRAIAEAADAINAGARERWLGLYADGVVVEDRRSILATRLVGRDALAASFDGGPQVQVGGELLATRGDRLALVSASYAIAGDLATLDVLDLVEVDAQGQVTLGVVLDGDDLDAALDLLDERWVATVGDDVREAAGLVLGARDAMNAEDPEALRALLADDAVVVDHRPAGWGELGVDAYVELARAARGLIAGRRFRAVELPRLEPWGVLGLVVTTGVAADGGAVELRNWLAARFAGGRIDRMEVFAVEDADDADACLDRWRP